MADERLAATLVASLYQSGRTAYYSTPASAGFLLLILWDVLPAALLFAWFGLVLALTLARLALDRRYRRTAIPPQAARWEARLALCGLAAGALWAFAATVFLPEGDTLRQIAIILVIGGNLIGAAGVYASSPLTFYSFSALPLLAMTVHLALRPGDASHLVALLVLTFAAIIVQVFRNLYRDVLRALRTQLENEDLVQRLAQNEAQLRDAIERSPDGIALYDAGDRLVMCNETYARAHGKGRGAAALAGTPYAVIAQNAWEAEVVPPEYEGRRPQWLDERVARQRTGVGAVRYYQMRDGRHLRGQFVRSRRGGVVSVFSDVSEKHEADKAMRRSEAMYRNLVETSNDLIWSMDSRGRWTYLNAEAVRRIYGCEPAAMLGREMREVLAPELFERDLVVFRRVLAGESVFDYQTRHLRRDGSHVDLAFNAVPLSDAAGAVVGATGTAHDVTREKQAAAAFTKASRSCGSRSTPPTWTTGIGTAPPTQCTSSVPSSRASSARRESRSPSTCAACTRRTANACARPCSPRSSAAIPMNWSSALSMRQGACTGRTRAARRWPTAPGASTA